MGLSNVIENKEELLYVRLQEIGFNSDQIGFVFNKVNQRDLPANFKPSRLLSSSFIFNDTKEGSEYWHKIRNQLQFLEAKK